MHTRHWTLEEVTKNKQTMWERVPVGKMAVDSMVREDHNTEKSRPAIQIAEKEPPRLRKENV